MKKTLLLVLAATLLAGAVLSSESEEEKDPYGPGDVITRELGTIQKVGEEWYGIVPQAEPRTRFAPDQLPKSFEHDGILVVFSGVVGEIPADVRMWGTPLELTEIELAEE